MDDHEGKPQPSGFHLNGLLPDQSASVTRVLDTERWSRAEKRVAQLIDVIQPNQASENRRNAIESYMRRLITECFPCQVVAYGSVPLKTYLPDGDIDLVAFSKSKDLIETWSIIVKEVLDKDMKREDAEFRVKEVQIIYAKIKLVKCIAENIVVDISFNQLGDLCALCYLEEQVLQDVMVESCASASRFLHVSLHTVFCLLGKNLIHSLGWKVSILLIRCLQTTIREYVSKKVDMFVYTNELPFVIKNYQK